MVTPSDLNPYEPPEGRSTPPKQKSMFWPRVIRWVALVWLGLFAVLMLCFGVLHFVTDALPIWFGSLVLVVTVGTVLGFVVLMVVSIVAVIVALAGPR